MSSPITCDELNLPFNQHAASIFLFHALLFLTSFSFVYVTNDFFSPLLSVFSIFLFRALLFLISYFFVYVTNDFFSPLLSVFPIFLAFHDTIATDMQCCNEYSHGRSTSSK